MAGSHSGERPLPPALVYRNTDERPGPADMLNDSPMRWLIPLVLLIFASFGAVVYFLVTTGP